MSSVGKYCSELHALMFAKPKANSVYLSIIVRVVRSHRPIKLVKRFLASSLAQVQLPVVRF